MLIAVSPCYQLNCGSEMFDKGQRHGVKDKEIEERVNRCGKKCAHATFHTQDKVIEVEDED
jgi:hypothetical protein